MNYKLKLNHHSEFKIFEIGKMSARNYFIPHNTLEEMESTTIFNERKLSKKVIFLNGEWSFKYYSKSNDLPDSFDTSMEKFDTITVPSVWQRTGYEKPNYLNQRYQFKLNPPIVPNNVPVGVYLKKVNIEYLDKNYLINFLGVCSCFDLFVNGKFVGYSEGSHNTAEFDITKFLTIGDNEILLTVYKWCNGSYLECQDMFRENGIFRDVFIIVEDSTYLYDFGYDTKYNQDGTYNFLFDYTLNSVNKLAKVKIELLDSNKNVILEDTFIKSQDKKEYSNLKVLEWTAETPNLYELRVYTILNDKTISVTRKDVGFKHIEIKGNVFYFNNQKIKLYGVNHHESHPKNGYVMTIEELEKDVKLLKDYNANCVRLSHYIHDPLFLSLCDRYGLYSVDEMDIECHGIYANPLNQQFGRISNNLEWKEHFLDRAYRMYYRDRCHASITMWSLGNEAGGYMCHDACYDFIKSKSNIPIQYEGAIHTKRFCYDIVGNFYPAFSMLEEIGNGTIKDKRFLSKPYFMTEYAHAMGVGPGGLDKYVNFIQKYDNFVGGCIWEFCDHVAEGTHEKYRYTYGGDYNEKKHDGNFCVDGLFFPDREPSTGALNMRECYRPIRCEQKDNKFIFTNYRSFLDSSDITITWQVYRNGNPTTTGNVDIVIPANSSVETDILVPIPRDMSEYVLKITYMSKDNKYIASENFAITPPILVKPKLEKPNYKIENGYINISFDSGNMKICKKTGEITSYILNDTQLINQKPRLNAKGILPNMYRKTLDNDRFIKILWSFLGTLKAKPRHISTKIVEDNNKLKVVSKYSFRSFTKVASAVVVKEIGVNGEILVDMTMKKALKLAFYSDIVRCGTTLELSRNVENITYYGLGDRETLSDFNEHGKVGIYSLKVSDMHERYIMPQESGNRSEVRYAKLTTNDGIGLQISSIDKLLNVNANHYTRVEIENANHMEDLKEVDTTCVQVDGFMRGTGTQSCGPGPTIEHRPNLKTPLHFSYLITPIK